MRFDILCFALPMGLEWIIILVIALLIFGNRISSIARSIGRSLSEFRRGTKEITDIKDDIKKDIKDAIK